MALAVIGSGSCTTRISQPLKVQYPVTIFVVVNGIHGGLVLPKSESKRMVQFDFGDWEYYARANKWPNRALGSLFVPTAGTIGRREVMVSDRNDPLKVCRAVGADRIMSLTVERKRMIALHDRLEQRFYECRSSYIYDVQLDTGFVIDHDDYHLLHTCNHVLEDWLVELGCTVSGAYWTWDFEVNDFDRGTEHIDQYNEVVAVSR